jgi:hypothetical protein
MGCALRARAPHCTLTGVRQAVEPRTGLSMLLVFQGWASVTGLVGAALVGAAMQSVTGGRAVSFFIAGVALAAFGWFVNSGSVQRHALFWLPIQYWGALIAIGALLGL